MSSKSNDDASHHEGAVLEDVQHKLTAILEGQESMAAVPQKVNSIDERLARVESDVKVIKAAVTDQTHQLTDHETRVTKLEEATA